MVLNQYTLVSTAVDADYRQIRTVESGLRRIYYIVNRSKNKISVCYCKIIDNPLGDKNKHFFSGLAYVLKITQQFWNWEELMSADVYLFCFYNERNGGKE